MLDLRMYDFELAFGIHPIDDRDHRLVVWIGFIGENGTSTAAISERPDELVGYSISRLGLPGEIMELVPSGSNKVARYFIDFVCRPALCPDQPAP